MTAQGKATAAGIAQSLDPATRRHVGTFRESCAQHDCPGCPDPIQPQDSLAGPSVEMVERVAEEVRSVPAPREPEQGPEDLSDLTHAEATGSLQDEIQEALTVKYPPGTPEHSEYVRVLREELTKFVNREGPYAEDSSLAADPVQERRARKALGMTDGDAAAVASHVLSSPLRATESAERVRVGDHVTIHRGTDLWEVLSVETEWSKNNLDPASRWERTDMARVVPVAEDDERGARWLNVDLLHVKTRAGQTV